MVLDCVDRCNSRSGTYLRASEITPGSETIIASAPDYSYPPHKHRTIVRNMREYLKFIQSHDRLDTFVNYDLGDGIAVSRII